MLNTNYRGKTLLYLLKKYIPVALRWDKIAVYQHRKLVFSGWIVFDEDLDVSVTSGFQSNKIDEEKTLALSKLLDCTIDCAGGTKSICIN